MTVDGLIDALRFFRDNGYIKGSDRLFISNNSFENPQSGYLTVFNGYEKVLIPEKEKQQNFILQTMEEI
jgi:hypothetical protein